MVAHVVALGSSYAAGPGIKPVVNKAAMRSGANYAHLVAERLGAQLTDLSVSGATTSTLLTKRQRTVTGRSFPPQIEGVPADADLVTITAGGNDVRYIGGLLSAGVTGWLRGRSRLRRPAASLLRRRPVLVIDDADVRAVVSGLVDVVEAVRRRAPQAEIYLVDYVSVVGPRTTAGPRIPLQVSELDAVRRVKQALDGAFASAAEQTGVHLLAASTLSAGHELGSAEPWVFGLQPIRRLASSFHPNPAGMRAIADELYRQITTA